MMRSFYQAITGMNAMADGISVTGNNIANSKTTGFKTREAQFSDLMYQNMRTATGPGERFAGRNPISLGAGVRMSGVAIDQTQGAIVPTGRKTDVAINGEGYFIAGDINGGNKQYTRDGSFVLSQDSRLVTKDGNYVMGWNVDEGTGRIHTTSDVEPINIGLDKTSQPIQTTRSVVSGNLNADAEIGDVTGMQIPIYDTLGASHNVDFNFIKTGAMPEEYTYIASAASDFRPSDSVSSATFRPSSGIAENIKKGEYQIQTNSVGGGVVEISLVDPDGQSIVSKEISDSDQTVTLDDGKNSWFTVKYESGQGDSTAYFEIAEVGSLNFNSVGSIEEMSGSGANGNAQLNFTSKNTGNPLSVDVNLSELTSLATETKVRVKETDGLPAAVLKDFELGDNGAVYGIYSDGTMAEIARLAVATFENPDGLNSVGGNYYTETANSGDPTIGVAGQGDAGEILSNSLEQSNVDTAKELTELMMLHKGYSANSKTIQITNQILDVSINLIR